MLLSNFPATGWLFLLFLHIQFLLRKIYRKLQEALFKQVTPSSVHNSHCHTQGILGKDIEFLSFYSLLFYSLLFPGLMLQNATNIHISAIKSIQSILVVTLFNSEVVDSKQTSLVKDVEVVMETPPPIRNLEVPIFFRPTLVKF